MARRPGCSGGSWCTYNSWACRRRGANIAFGLIRTGRSHRAPSRSSLMCSSTYVWCSAPTTI
eukprot:5120980-Lingulodinium_polyedra.AAC.1